MKKCLQKFSNLLGLEAKIYLRCDLREKFNTRKERLNCRKKNLMSFFVKTFANHEFLAFRNLHKIQGQDWLKHVVQIMTFQLH